MKYTNPTEGLRDAAKDALAGKKPKSEVDYRTGSAGEHCGLCEYFEKKGPNQCLKVAGHITANMLCDLFEEKDSDDGKATGTS